MDMAGVDRAGNAKGENASLKAIETSWIGIPNSKLRTSGNAITRWRSVESRESVKHLDHKGGSDDKGQKRGR